MTKRSIFYLTMISGVFFCTNVKEDSNVDTERLVCIADHSLQDIQASSYFCIKALKTVDEFNDSSILDKTNKVLLRHIIKSENLILMI